MSLQQEMIPLSEVPEGRTVELVTIDAGRGLKSRLTSMGLMPRVKFTVMNNSHPGPFVVSVRGSRTMLGRGMADKLFVRVLDVE